MLVKMYTIVQCIVFLSFAENIWVETTQQDFVDGIYERNIYASHRNGGTIEFAARFDLNGDGYIDLVTHDIGGPYVTIYWGSSSGYSGGNLRRFPSTGGGNCDVADVNTDGYPDFIVSHANSDSRLAIYWGSPTGPSPHNVFNIPNSPSVPNEICYAADLNKDGYLDIVIGTYQSLYTGSIFWGSVDGYSPSNRTDLPTSFGAHNIEIADLNNDNWLDIIFVNNNGSVNYIYWGSSSGYSASNKTMLTAPTSTPHGSSVADLNNDDYLDLVFTSVYGSQSFLYYGSATGYHTYQALNTGSAYGGSAVCDFNHDGYLDIVFFRAWSTARKPVIYWGSSTGYSDLNKIEIGYPTNGSGGFVADLNYDGYFDILVNSRSSTSPIFWGPDYTTYTNFSVNRDHHAMFREIGNTYTREYHEDYISSVFDAGETADWGTIEWDASLPRGTSISFWVRSGDTPSPNETWSEWYFINENNGPIPEYLNARYLQYKTRFAYISPAYLPSLNEVSVTYTVQEIISASVTIEPEVINLKSHGVFTAFIILPLGYDPYDVDVTTLICEGAHAKDGMAAEDRYIAKFNIQDLVGIGPGSAVQFMVTGQLYNGMQFCGYDTVRVIHSEFITLSYTPNPIRCYSTFTISNLKGNNASVKLYDVTGKLIRELSVVKNNNVTGTAIWNRKDRIGRRVPAGIYFLKIKNQDAIVTNKVIVLD